MVSLSWCDKNIKSAYIPIVEQYVAILSDRLLPQFSFVENEAEELAEREYKHAGEMSGDEEVDMATCASKAQDMASTWYKHMMDMRQSLINLYAIGLRHIFEQQLYDFVKRNKLTIRENAEYKEDCKDLKKIGIAVEEISTWQTLEELRHLSNCIKHAEGSSAKKLKERRIDLFKNPQLINVPPLNLKSIVVQPLSGENVYVKPQDLSAYVNAVKQFWIEVSKALAK